MFISLLCQREVQGCNWYSLKPFGNSGCCDLWSSAFNFMWLHLVLTIGIASVAFVASLFYFFAWKSNPRKYLFNGPSTSKAMLVECFWNTAFLLVYSVCVWWMHLYVFLIHKCERNAFISANFWYCLIRTLVFVCSAVFGKLL